MEAKDVERHVRLLSQMTEDFKADLAGLDDKALKAAKDETDEKIGALEAWAEALAAEEQIRAIRKAVGT